MQDFGTIEKTTDPVIVAQADNTSNDQRFATRGERRPRDAKTERPEFDEQGFKEVVISINRVSRTVKGGRRMSFQALIVVGDGNNKVGMGVAKALDVQSAVAKAGRRARRAVKEIAITKNGTIAHEVFAKKDGVSVLLKPASLGTGLIAGGTARAVLSVTGIKNIVAKSQGSSNKANNAYATIDALTKLSPIRKWTTRSANSRKETKGDN